MTGPSEVDPAVLAGEPDSVHQLERGDDDLPPLAPADQEDEPAPSEQARTGAEQARTGEWAAADALLSGQPTALGERPPGPA